MQLMLGGISACKYLEIVDIADLLLASTWSQTFFIVRRSPRVMAG
jgi:hypothetical protein